MKIELPHGSSFYLYAILFCIFFFHIKNKRYCFEIPFSIYILFKIASLSSPN